LLREYVFKKKKSIEESKIRTAHKSAKKYHSKPCILRDELITNSRFAPECIKYHVRVGRVSRSL